MPGLLGDLARKIGDLTELSRRCRVNETTIRRWATGRMLPHYLVALHVNSVAKRERARMPFVVTGVGNVARQASVRLAE